LLIKICRYLLLPISFIYGVVIWFRNFLFDHNILKSAEFNFPVICVGNLAVGGTGKTPMTEYLADMLQDQYQVATLSRGYKRKTKGFAIADADSTAIEIGDEPMQFHQKFPGITVAVGEERLVAIPQLLHQKPATDVIILDDAFQHRSVKAGLNIVLTEYNHLYTRALLLPAGNLRDVKSSMKRAHIIIVTKCKPDLSQQEREKILKEIKPEGHQKVFFTAIVYGEPYSMFSKEKRQLNKDTGVLLICGIANPGQIKTYVEQRVNHYEFLRFPDHHIFTIENLAKIKKQFEEMKTQDKLMVTTEKDAVRLVKFEKELSEFPVYVLPIRHNFLFDQAEQFRIEVLQFISGFPKDSL
jgi:tetraacyldisaccharide 4'-kinase